MDLTTKNIPIIVLQLITTCICRFLNNDFLITTNYLITRSRLMLSSVVPSVLQQLQQCRSRRSFKERDRIALDIASDTTSEGPDSCLSQ